MSNGDDSGALSRSAGFVSGFTGALREGMGAQAKAAMEERKLQEERAKWEASNELMRELKGAKTMKGQELIDYGRGLGVDAKVLGAAFNPTKDYEPEAARAWISSAGSLRRAGITEAGKNGRQRAVNKAIPMEKYIPVASEDAARKAGIPKGVSPGDPGLDKETQDRYNTFYKDSLRGMVRGWENTTGQSSGLDIDSPYADIEQQWKGFKNNQITPGTVFKTGAPSVRATTLPPVKPAAAPQPGVRPLSLDQLPME